MNSQFTEIDLNSIDDNRGKLLSFESMRNIPFELKRVYILTSANPELARGFHAHKKLKQLIFCPTGSCDFLLEDRINKKSIHLNSPNKGILIEGVVWREMHNISTDCSIVVFADEYYDEDDYIRDYNDFSKALGERNVNK